MVSFKSPADTPAMPGMLRKSTAFVPRYQKFESSPLQQRVHKLSVPVRAGRRIAFTRAYRMQPLAQLPAVCATGLAAAAGWSDRWVIVTGSSNPLLSSRQSAETLSVHEGTLPVASAGSRNRK